MLNPNASAPEAQIASNPAGVPTPEAGLTRFLEEELLTLGYELVALEILNHRERKLTVYIDRKETEAEGITIEDCVRVTHALDAPLEAQVDLQAIFKGPYDLEVSSPGINRPLRKASDYTRFAGEIARIHTTRPLTADETKNPEYSLRNPKQKNFYGILRGHDPVANSIRLGVIPEDGTRTKPGSKKKEPKPETPILIPMDWVAKANLEREVRSIS